MHTSFLSLKAEGQGSISFECISHAGLPSAGLESSPRRQHCVQRQVVTALGGLRLPLPALAASAAVSLPVSACSVVQSSSSGGLGAFLWQGFVLKGGVTGGYSFKCVTCSFVEAVCVPFAQASV